MDFTLVSPSILTGIGVAGFCLYVLTYTLLSLRILSGNCILYFSLNLLAAACVMIGLMVNFNLASALIQGFWITMSVFAIGIRIAKPTRRMQTTRRSVAQVMRA